MHKKVLKLFISTNKKENPREEVTSLKVDPQGVIGDKFYNKDPKRTILLSSTKSYILTKENGIDLNYGDLGENILINIDPYSLGYGSKLRIGNVEFAISQHCTLCKSLSKIDTKLPKLLRNDRGIFIQALHSGIISVHDHVELL